MHQWGSRGGWAVGAIGLGLLVGGCTDSAPTAAVSSATALVSASASPLACGAIEVRDVEAVGGDWVLAEYVLVRGPEGTTFTVTMPADAPASVAMGDAPTPGSSQTRTGGLSVERATVTTDPASDLDPATLQAAIVQTGRDPLSLTNTAQEGFAGQLQAELGADGAVAYRGARQTTVTFSGDCSSPSMGPVPVTGTGRYFDLGEAGVLDCAKPPAEPGTLAAAAAEYCTTE